MENKLTPEIIEKAKQAKTIEELLKLAEENGIELSSEEAKAYFERLTKSGELSDEELDNVAGGGCSSMSTCARCGYPLDQIDGQWVCRGCGNRF